MTAASSGGAGELLARNRNRGPTWTAIVETSDGSSLTGTWSYTGETGGCSGGTCSLSGIRKKVSSVDFTSGTGTTVTVFKP